MVGIVRMGVPHMHKNRLAMALALESMVGADGLGERFAFALPSPTMLNEGDGGCKK